MILQAARHLRALRLRALIDSLLGGWRTSGAGRWAAMLLVLGGVFVATPAMAQNPCASEVWTAAPGSFNFPASVNPATVYSISVTNSPASTLCQWSLAVLAGSDTSWYVANQNGQTGVNITVSPNCPGQQVRAGTLLIFALDPHTMAPSGPPVAIIQMTQASVTVPVLSNLSPNGGQSYALGSNQTVTWTYTPSTDALINDTGSIYLLRNQLAIQLLGTVHLGAQTLPWVVPANTFPTGFLYEINVVGEASDPRYPGCAVLTSVTSQSPFEIKAPTASVSCPNNSGTVGQLYSSALGATGGQPPFTFSIASGSLPSGLILTPGTGAIAGTPIAAGTSTFTAQVVDSSGAQGTASCSIVVDNCNYHIEGPSDVPGLAQYTYELQLPAGNVATGLSWTSDKPTASINPAGGPTGALPNQAIAQFQNTKPDYINLKASFTLNGVKACAVKPVALVQVTVGPATFTNPGTATANEDGFHRFLVKPPAPGTPRPWWKIVFTPGSHWKKFKYLGTKQDSEPLKDLDSRTPSTAEHRTQPAFIATSPVTLTSPTEKSDAQQSIQVGFIQGGADTGSANFDGGLTRTVIVPTATTVDWLSASALDREHPKKASSDLWPWYDQTAERTGTGTGVWTSVPPLRMSDSPGQFIPAKYNPNYLADPDGNKDITTGAATLAFVIEIGARTLDTDLKANTHYFNEANSTWKVNFVWPLVAPNMSIVTLGPPWKTPATPTEIPVNVVPTIINHNIPYLRWNPATCPPVICPLNP